MKYNYTFVINDIMMEVKIEAALRSDGYRVERRGRRLTVMGINDEWRALIERYADGLWAF